MVNDDAIGTVACNYEEPTKTVSEDRVQLKFEFRPLKEINEAKQLATDLPRKRKFQSVPKYNRNALSNEDDDGDDENTSATDADPASQTKRFSSHLPCLFGASVLSAFFYFRKGDSFYQRNSYSGLRRQPVCWTDDELLFIAYGVRLYGSDYGLWSKILTRFKNRFNDRTNVDLSSKFLYLKKTNKLKDYERLIDNNMSLIEKLVSREDCVGSIYQILTKQ